MNVQSQQSSKMSDKLKNVYKLLKTGVFGDAEGLLEEALAMDFDNGEFLVWELELVDNLLR